MGKLRSVNTLLCVHVLDIDFLCMTALLDGLRKCNDQTVMGCMPLPSFHTMGVMTQLLAPMYCLIISAIYPPIAKTPASLPITPTPDNILDHMRRTKVNGIVMVPTLLHTLSQDKTKLDFLAAMSFVVSIFC